MVINLIEKYKNSLIQKLKFGMSSIVATVVDYGLFWGLVIFQGGIFSEFWGNMISASVGMLINFMLQKRFVFELKRNVYLVFIMSVLISLGGVLLGSTIIKLLVEHIQLFESYKIGAKLVATGTIFFYNFYLKRFAFEDRFLGKKSTSTDEQS